MTGSTILATDALTNVVSSRGYYAFGATRRSSGLTPTDRRFTGQVEDSTGLYYYNSRYYDPQLGQFLSPDTLPSGHYSVEELQQHFGVNSFDELMALFGEGGEYEDNSGWYDILRAAQDGDQITAVLPDAVTSISGNFTRNADGQIQIDMGGGQVVDENVFAVFGGHRTGMTYNGHPAEYGAYYLQGTSGARWATATSGTQAMADVPCNTWDCVAIGYDATSLGGSVLTSVSLAGALPSGGLTIAGVAAGVTINQTATAAGLIHTVRGYGLGKSSAADLIVNSATATLNPFPGIGTIAGIGQLAWDIFDPIIPD